MDQMLPTSKDDFYKKAFKLSFFSIFLFPIVGQIVCLGLLWKGWTAPGSASRKAAASALGAIGFILLYVVGLWLFFAAYRRELFSV